MNCEQTTSTISSAPDDLNDEVALRWRRAILRLSGTFMDAAGERSDLSPFLLEAMHNALNNLLVYGEAGDLMALEEWLSVEDEAHAGQLQLDGVARPHTARASDRRRVERRLFSQPIAAERRLENERRATERRALRDWKFEPVQATPYQSSNDLPHE